MPHDTPVDTPRVTPPSKPVMKKSKQELAQDQQWGQQAAQLKADGYNSAVVARKMIQVHGMSEAGAEALVGSLFGKKVNARAGDTTSAVVSGLVMTGVALGGAILFFAILGFAFIKLTFLVYAALLGLAGKGASQAFIAMVNSGGEEPLQK
jgi:hypothetical protein